MSIVMPRNPETGTISGDTGADQAVLVWRRLNAPAVADA